MLLRKYIKAKIHGIRVTRAELDYHGSVGIDNKLLELVGIEPYESVLVVNLTSGARWETYAIPTDHGEFHLNGGSAHLGKVGDRCLVMTFGWEEKFSGAKVVVVDENNNPAETLIYSQPIGTASQES